MYSDSELRVTLAETLKYSMYRAAHAASVNGVRITCRCLRRETEAESHQPYKSLPTPIYVVEESLMIRCFYHTFFKNVMFPFSLIPLCCKYSLNLELATIKMTTLVLVLGKNATS